MNIRNLRNKLPGVIVRAEGRGLKRRVHFTQGQVREGEKPLTYSISGSDKSRSAEEVAATIRSKMPIATIAR